MAHGSERYAHEPVPAHYDPAYWERELYKLAAALVASRELEEYNVEPDKYYDGMVVIADGTNWDPGSGAGMYYYQDSSWRFVCEIASAGYWDDYTADLSTARPGLTNPPDTVLFRGNIPEFAFDPGINEDVSIAFHIKHDIKLGTKVYFHLHWSPGNSTNTGVVRWGFEYSLAKGHEQEVFPTTTTVYVEQAATGTPYQHQIAEVSDGDAIDSASVEPDTLVLVRIFRDASHVNDTFTGDAFGLECDLHYQRDRVGTKNKAPDFYV
jgi:hypothetical protein